MSRSPVPSLRSAVTAALLLSLAACGAGDRAESRTDTAPVVRDSAGVRIVEKTGPLWRAGEGWRIVSASTAAPAPAPAADSVSAPVSAPDSAPASAPTAPPVPAIDIGVFDGDPAYQLHRVVGALRLDDGRIVVLNDGSAEIRFYDDAGRHLRTVGGRGEGPGEFQALGGVVRAGGDSLLVLDRRLPRVSVLDTDGGLLGTIPLSPLSDTARFPGVRSLPTYGLAGRFSDGRLLGSLTLPDIDVHDVGDDYVLGVWKDDVDVEHVRLYRLNRGMR